MVFCGRPENVNLTYSIKFILVFTKGIVSVNHQEAKAIEFIQCLINFGETSQERPNSVLK